ncbi:YdeI/OmpD-associated family protein [Emticicia oligotrophica]|nr:YdeI/OmpD-associated family protein [Emticicia oligotrophica]
MGVLSANGASYRIATNWIMSAKQEVTQLKRIQQLIEDSEQETNQMF